MTITKPSNVKGEQSFMIIFEEEMVKQADNSMSTRI